MLLFYAIVLLYSQTLQVSSNRPRVCGGSQWIIHTLRNYRDQIMLESISLESPMIVSLALLIDLGEPLC